MGHLAHFVGLYIGKWFLQCGLTSNAPYRTLNIFEQGGLNWGSVQAETVRLQSQIEPGLMDIHLKFTEFCNQE